MRTMKIAIPIIVCVLAFSQALHATSSVKCHVELDRDILLADDLQTAVIKVTLEAPPPPETNERPPVNLAIVLDRSGSMTGTKIEKAKEAAIEALNRLNGRDIFSLVIYDDRIESIVPAQSAANREWIISRIRQIQPRGNTALFAGVSQGAAEIRKNLGREYVNRIILLSDGLANIGPSTPADLGRLGVALSKEGISVTTVGVGTDYNEDLMTQISQKSDGNTYFVETSSDLPRIFAAELGDVLSVVAQKVSLNILCVDGTKPIRIIGRDGRVYKDHVEINLNQLYGGQEKYTLIEIEIPPTPANEKRELAIARVRYDNAINQNEEESSGKVIARFSNQKEDVYGSARESVQKDIMLNTVAETQDKAIELWDAGKEDEAIGAMKAMQQDFGARVDAYNLDGAFYEGMDVTIDGNIQRLETDGMDKRGRKLFRTDSYQIRNQQSRDSSWFSGISSFFSRDKSEESEEKDD